MEERKDRVGLAIKKLAITRNKAASMCNIDPSNFNKMLEGKLTITDKTIDKFAKGFPQINREWLLSGNGEMVDKDVVSGTAYFAGAYIPENLKKVRTMDISPTATFTEFAETTEKEFAYTYILPREGEEIGDEDVVFTIHGRSMEPTIPDKASVLGMLIRKPHWHWAKGVVIIAYGNSFVIKRIVENKLDSANYLILGSDNPEPEFKETIKVPLCDIRIMFQAERIVDALIR